MNFRTLRADEIETRCQQVTEKGYILLLYKDARADMKILDETVGVLNWKREHARENANCIVSIWDKEKFQWISKEDTGAESNTEKEKGQASDSFKRACVNWGIGRELYTTPFIWINSKQEELEQDNNKKFRLKKSVNFTVSKIEYDSERNITALEIQDNKKTVRYKMGEFNIPSDEQKQPKNESKQQASINTPKTPQNDSKGQNNANGGQVALINTLVTLVQGDHKILLEHYKVKKYEDLLETKAEQIIKQLKAKCAEMNIKFEEE